MENPWATGMKNTPVFYYGFNSWLSSTLASGLDPIEIFCMGVSGGCMGITQYIIGPYSFI